MVAAISNHTRIRVMVAEISNRALTLSEKSRLLRQDRPKWEIHNEWRGLEKGLARSDS
jgi:hypothetical protein